MKIYQYMMKMNVAAPIKTSCLEQEMQRTIALKLVYPIKRHYRFNQCLFFSSDTLKPIPYGGESQDPLYTDIPKPPQDKSERKPYPTPMEVLIQRAKQEKEARKAQPCRMLEHSPDNGLLVPELVPVAHRVYRARESLLSGLNKLVRLIPVQRCRFCHEVHIGKVGHEIRTCTAPGSGMRSAKHVWRKGRVHDVIFFPKCFHLEDRAVKPRVVHDDRLSVPRIPAIVELCIQAGVDLEKWATKRRTKAVYSIEGRIVDFEEVGGSDEMRIREYMKDHGPPVDLDSETTFDESSLSKIESGKESNAFDDWSDEVREIRELSTRTMESWFEMVSGAKKIMEKYSVLTCGYCSEVQVGPKGHKVRDCKGTKHQARDGQHAWQEATLSDLVGPNYVWHVRELNGSPLDNKLKRYYGKAPAVVELCVQVGAPIPDQYRSMMRLDVVPPDRDEVDLVA